MLLLIFACEGPKYADEGVLNFADVLYGWPIRNTKIVLQLLLRPVCTLVVIVTQLVRKTPYIPVGHHQL